MPTTIKLKNGSGAPLATDLVQGEVALDLTNKRIYSENASGTVIEMGTSPSTIDINAGTIDGTIIGGASAAAGTFTTLQADTSLNVDGTITADGADLDGAVVINESGADVDFRVEGDTDENLLFVDASTDRVGVGTNAPDALLTVDGIASFGAGAAATPSIAAAGDLNTGMFFPAADTIAASTAGTERMRIDSSGNLGIGNSGNSSYKLYVTSNAATQSAVATQGVSGDTAYQAVLITKFDNDSTTSQNFIQFQINNGAANSGKITANGANAATFTSTSDERVKQNIVGLPSQLEKICALRPVEFDYIESEGGGHQIGFIAQDMQKIYSDVVSEQEDGMLQISGWSKTEARLVKAIQEQQEQIETLKAEVAALKAN